MSDSHVPLPMAIRLLLSGPCFLGSAVLIYAQFKDGHEVFSMFIVVPFLAFLSYIFLGFLVSRLLFWGNGILFCLSMLAVVVAPFVYDQIYTSRLVADNLPLCDSLISAPLGLSADSTVVVYRKLESDPVLRRKGFFKLGSPGSEAREPLYREFLAVFKEHFGTGELELRSTNNVDGVSVCAVDENENDCGNRLLSEHPSLNLVTTGSPSGFNPLASKSIRYSVWGSAMGDEEVVREWTRFVKFRGSLLDGGWTFWWPYPGNAKLLDCTSNDLEFIDWLINTETK